MDDQSNNLEKKLDQLQIAIGVLKGEDVYAVKRALELVGELESLPTELNQPSPFEIGKCYFIRTVTFYQVGQVENILGQFIKLKDASWIADTGRFADALKNGTFSEIEPVGTCYVNLGSVVDIFPWNHDLPTEQK